jgi:hypothetical protein
LHCTALGTAHILPGHRGTGHEHDLLSPERRDRLAGRNDVSEHQVSSVDLGQRQLVGSIDLGFEVRGSEAAAEQARCGTKLSR